MFLEYTISALTAEMFSIDIMHRDPATILGPHAISISCAVYNNIPSPLLLLLLLLCRKFGLSRVQQSLRHKYSTS